MDLDFLPGSAALAESVDARVLCVLRDGRALVGVLRSFDQFGSCVLEGSSERLFVTRAEAFAASSSEKGSAEEEDQVRRMWDAAVAAQVDGSEEATGEETKTQEEGNDGESGPMGVFAERRLGLYIVRGENVTLISDLAAPGDFIPKYDGVAPPQNGGKGGRRGRGRNQQPRQQPQSQPEEGAAPRPSVSDALAENERAALHARGHVQVDWARAKVSKRLFAGQ
jgi:small nuclear ribonucleoprotein (snRNP)-like protein